MNEQLDLLADDKTPSRVVVTLTLAVASLRILSRGIEGEEGAIDRTALRMAIKAIEELQAVRRWVREFGGKYTAEELAERADAVERLGVGSKEAW